MRGSDIFAGSLLWSYVVDHTFLLVGRSSGLPKALTAMQVVILYLNVKVCDPYGHPASVRHAITE